MDGKNILLVYQSKRGSAQQAAEWIAETLPECDVVDLGKRGIKPDPAEYETVVIGTGMEAGSAYKQIQKFIKQHRDTLLQKELALFITHLAEGEDKIEEDFTNAFDADFLNHARVRAGLGGRLRLKELNFMLRTLMRKIGESQDQDLANYDTLSREACVEFARKVKTRD